MLCILIDELRLSRFHQILNYLKSPFLPTLLKLAVLFGCKPKPLHGHCRLNRSRDELRDATIALPFQSLLTTLVFQWLKRSLPNIVLHVQKFCFVYFLNFVVVLVALKFVVGLQCETILDMRRFRLKSLFPQVPIHRHNPCVKLKGISGRYSIISIGFFFLIFFN